MARLIHAHSVCHPFILENARSRNLADLVGQDRTGNWHVIEAKARQKSPSERDRAKWKLQACTVRTIGGVTPATRSYACTNVSEQYSVEIVDPPPQEGGEDDDLPITSEAVLKKYYEPLRSWLKEGGTKMHRNGTALVTKPFALDAADGQLVHLGLREEILGGMHADNLLPGFKSWESEDTYIGSDGIAIITSVHEGESDKRHHRGRRDGGIKHEVNPVPGTSCRPEEVMA